MSARPAAWDWSPSFSAACALHELGHALVGQHAGIPIKAVVLLPIGGITLLDETQQTDRVWRANLEAGHPHRVGRPAGQPARLRPWRQVFCWRSLLRSSSGRILTSIPGTCRAAWCGPTSGWPHSICCPPIPWTAAACCALCSADTWTPVRATRRAVSIGNSLATVLILAGMLQYMQWNNPDGAWISLIGFFLFDCRATGRTLSGFSIGARNRAS